MAPLPRHPKQNKTKTQVEVISKDYYWLMKTRYPELMNLVRFYLWEDTSIWSYWSYPLICILTIKDQYHVFLHPESLRVNPVEACVCVCVCVCVCLSAVVHGLMATTSFVYWNGRGRSLYTGCYNKLPRPGSLNNIYSLPHSFRGWKWKTQGTGSVDSSWGLSGKDLLLTFLFSWQMTIFSLCLFPSIKTQSYWTKVHP